MSDDALRSRIERLLADGLATDATRRAYTSDDVAAVCRTLQALAPDDIAGKLAVAGFTPQPYVDANDEDGIEQACATCMYYERHRRFCSLPELMLPVEPAWSCILWRI